MVIMSPPKPPETFEEWLLQRYKGEPLDGANRVRLGIALGECWNAAWAARGERDAAIAESYGHLCLSCETSTMIADVIEADGAEVTR
jgi:hypothetical protein